MVAYADLETGETRFYLAAERVSPGRYREIHTGRIVCLEEEDFLPASLDGRVACYLRLRESWNQTAEGLPLPLSQ
jgi:hypothetical protein